MDSPLSINDQALQEALFSTIFDIPEIPGRFHLLRIPGVVGYITHSKQSRANNVCLAPGGVEDADAAVQQLVDRFSAEQSGFSWLVGPEDEPANQHLLWRLEAAGFNKSHEMAGMVLRDLAGPIYFQPVVPIREVSGAVMAGNIDLIRGDFGHTKETAELMLLKLSPDRQDARFRAYLAEIDDRPVGYAYMYYLPDLPLVTMRLAATHEAFRKQGIYHSLVARRLADARSDGMRSAIVASDRGTSTSSLADFGFHEFCSLSFYRWEYS